MKELLDQLTQQKLSLSSCESLTGGLFAAEFTAIPGASKAFLGGMVTYQNDIKERILSIPHETIETFGVVSKEVASLMATRAREIFQSDLCVSFTGNAGPDVLEGKAVGLVYIGLAFKDKVKVQQCQFHGTRREIQFACVNEAKTMIREWIRGK